MKNTKRRGNIDELQLVVEIVNENVGLKARILERIKSVSKLELDGVKSEKKPENKPKN